MAVFLSVDTMRLQSHAPRGKKLTHWLHQGMCLASELGYSLMSSMGEVTKRMKGREQRTGFWGTGWSQPARVARPGKLQLQIEAARGSRPSDCKACDSWSLGLHSMLGQRQPVGTILISLGWGEKMNFNMLSSLASWWPQVEPPKWQFSSRK